MGVPPKDLFMPRRPRRCPPGIPVHVVHRGNNRQAIFTGDTDIIAYANWLREASEKSGVDIHAWVFMTNHVHLLVTPGVANAVSRCMQFLGRHYVRYFNRRYERSGTLFDGRFRSSLVQTGRYYLACQRYIELNPVRAGLAADPADYQWSSYRAHALGQEPAMWKPHAEYLALGATSAAREAVWRQFFAEPLSAQVVTDIRHALNTGFVLGNDRFRRDVEVLTGIRQRHLKRGPRK